MPNVDKKSWIAGMMAFALILLGPAPAAQAAVDDTTPPGVPTEPVFMLSLLLAVVCASGGVHLVHARELGALRFRRLWQGLRLLPSRLQIGLGTALTDDSRST